MQRVVGHMPAASEHACCVTHIFHKVHLHSGRVDAVNMLQDGPGARLWSA